MVVIIESISEKALVRLGKSLMSNKIAWAGVRHKGEIDVCLEDDKYSIYTGSLFDKRDYVEIRNEENAFVIFTGEFKRVIVE